tara:strand:- start:2491 stop:2802 length:312 start_codon:yes stop_codon:yes gene_type:complete
MDDIEQIYLPASSMSNKRPFLKKGDGKLASDHHGSTEFSLKRQNSVIIDQVKTEKNHHQHNVEANALVKKYLNNIRKNENKENKKENGENNDKACQTKKEAWK